MTIVLVFLCAAVTLTMNIDFLTLSNKNPGNKFYSLLLGLIMITILNHGNLFQLFQSNMKILSLFCEVPMNIAYASG